MAFHGLGTYNLIGELSKLRSFDLFLCPNEFFINKLNPFVEGRLLPYGYPRLFNVANHDALNSRVGSFDDLYYIPHWCDRSSLFLNQEDVF